MSATADQELAELRRANAEWQRAYVELQNERNAALAELQARTAALAQRDSEYGERLEHQSATIDVLKVMSASPSDPQPVFDVIVRRASELCNVPTATLFEYDGRMVHWRSSYRIESVALPSPLETYLNLFPIVPTRGSISCRAILDRETVHVRDLNADATLADFVRQLGHRSQVSVPSMSYDIITQQHKGSIVVDSKVGEYSEFTVRLPRSR